MKRILCIIVCGLILVTTLSALMSIGYAGAQVTKIGEKSFNFPTDLKCRTRKDFPDINSPPTPSPLNALSEFIIVGGDDGRLFLFPSHGNGTFGPMNDIGNASDESSAISYVDFANAAIADFDNDNDFDFVAGAGGGRKRIYLFTNDGSGNFDRTMIFEQICYCIKFYQDFATADFDGDGYYDFVASGSPHGYIYVFTNNQDQTFTLKSMIDETWFNGVSAGIDTGDFDEDGNMDFLVADYGYERETQQAHLYLGNGNGTFKLRKDAIVLSGIGPGGKGELWAVTAGDFNNDGHLDAIVGQDDDFDPGQTYLFLGDGTGNFSYWGEAYDLYPSIESGEDLEGYGYADAFDFDHDGNLDIICADHGSIINYRGQIWFLKGNGDGTFQTPISVYDFGDFVPVMGISAPPYYQKGGKPPAADAGPDQTVFEGDVVNFDGTNSTGSVKDGSFGFGQNIRVNDDMGTAYQFYPSIAVDDLGYIHIVWMDNRSGDWDVYYAISFDGGKTFSHVQIPFPNGSAGQPAIDVDASGTAHIVFTGVDNKGYSDIYYTNTTDFGTTFSSNVKVNDGNEPVEAQQYPDIAVSDTGEIYIVWYDPLGIFFDRSTDGFGKDLKVNDPGDYGVLFPSISVDKGGNIYVVWFDDRNESPGFTNWDIYSTTSTDGGVSFSADVRVNDDNTTENQYHPKVAGGESGEVFVVWEDRRGPSRNDILFAKSSDSGASFEPNVKVNDETGGNQWSPSISFSRDGTIHVSWWDGRDVKWNVYYANSDDGGKTFSKNLRIDDAINEKIPIPDSIYAWYKGTDIAVDSSGNPHVVWHDKRNGDFDIYYVRVNVKTGEEAKIVSYEWDFDANVDSDGDGDPTNDVDAIGPKPTHIYGDNGYYTVSLKVTDEKGLSDTDTMLVSVENVAPIIVNLEAYIYVDLTLRIAGEKWHNVEVHLYEDGVEIGYEEIIRIPGNPNDQSITIPNVKCDATKLYTLTLLYTPEDDPINGQLNGATPCWVDINFEDGSYELLHNTFKVRHPETWEWNIVLNEYFVGHEITFIGEASDPGSDDLTFVWDFGDVCIDTNLFYNDGLNPDPYPSPWGIYPFSVTDMKKHIYTGAGNYAVTLTVIDDDCESDSNSLVVIIEDVTPIACAGGSYFGNEGNEINFIGAQIAPSISRFIKYYWDFGDGSISTQQNPMHSYEECGVYTVKLIVMDEWGETNFDVCDVYVNGPPIANAGVDLTVYVGEIVQFDGSGSYDLEGLVTSYEWDFNSNVDLDGDGNFINDFEAVGPLAQYLYATEGKYQVTLRVSDGFSIAMDTLTVTVLPRVEPVIDEEQEQQVDVEDTNIDSETEYEEQSKVFEGIIEDSEKDPDPNEHKEIDLPNPLIDTDDISNDNIDNDVPSKPSVNPLEDPDDEDKPNFPTYTITVTVSSIIISTLSLSLPLYMKINRKDLLKNRKRKLIYRYISTNPGDNFNGIKQALNLSNGVLSYHLKILERENFITSIRDGGYKRFYLSGKTKMNNIRRLNGVQRDIFNTIKNYPGISQTEIAQKNGTTVQVVNYHIKRLQEEGLIKLYMTNGHRSQCFLQNCEGLEVT